MLTPDPPQVQLVPGSDREWALTLAGALAWAVGRFEGMGVETGYAGEVLKQWHRPVAILKAPPKDEDA